MYVAFCESFPWTIPPSGGLWIPSRAIHICGEVQGTRDVSVHSIPCHRRIYRQVLLYHPHHVWVRHHVTSSCWFPERNSISQLRYVRAVTHHSATSATFVAPPQNFVEIMLLWMTAALTAIFGPSFCSRSQKKASVGDLSAWCTMCTSLSLLVEQHMLCFYNEVRTQIAHCVWVACHSH